VDAGDFCVLDVETSGGSMEAIPVGFELLLTGGQLRCRANKM